MAGQTEQDIPAKLVTGFIYAKLVLQAGHTGLAPLFALQTTRDLHMALHHLKSSTPLAAHSWTFTSQELCNPYKSNKATDSMWGSQAPFSSAQGPALAAWAFQNRASERPSATLGANASISTVVPTQSNGQQCWAADTSLVEMRGRQT